MSILNVIKLNKSFHNIQAIKDIDISVNAKEIYGIVGPDGAGKTTLLRCISGIIPFNSGKITYNKIDLESDLTPLQNVTGYMPQRFSLYPDLSVFENIDFYWEIYGIDTKNKDKKIDNILSSFSMLPFKFRKAGKLSGGMKQKLALACVLINTPKLLILDEPTNGVDPVSRREFWNILYDLKEKGVTIITSTSYLEEAERCDRVCMLYKGETLTSDTVFNIKKSIGKTMLVGFSINARNIYMIMKDKKYNSIFNLTGNKIKIFCSDTEKEKSDLLKILDADLFNNITFKEETPTLEDVFQYNVIKESKI